MHTRSPSAEIDENYNFLRKKKGRKMELLCRRLLGEGFSEHVIILVETMKDYKRYLHHGNIHRDVFNLSIPPVSA